MEQKSFEKKIEFLTSRQAFLITKTSKKLLSELGNSLNEEDSPILIFSIHDTLTKGIACFTRKKLIIIYKHLFGKAKIISFDTANFIYFRQENNAIYLHPKKYGDAVVLLYPTLKNDIYLIVKRLSLAIRTEKSYEESYDYLNTPSDSDSDI